ncbi:MAG: hypothetical protein FGM55_05360 [Rhodoferax sp.]|nr:hypothetical protein [Rhodoferax sp.]
MECAHSWSHLCRISWRHMLPSLKRKPGAFARWVLRDCETPDSSLRCNQLGGQQWVHDLDTVFERVGRIDRCNQ